MGLLKLESAGHLDCLNLLESKKETAKNDRNDVLKVVIDKLSPRQEDKDKKPE